LIAVVKHYEDLLFVDVEDFLILTTDTSNSAIGRCIFKLKNTIIEKFFLKRKVGYGRGFHIFANLKRFRR
jgi:hypothetical protein